MKKISSLKLSGFLFMLIDHVGVVLFPDLIVLRMIGRIAAPIFAYTTAVGYLHTRNVQDYLKRLFVFALVSQIPYNLSINPSNLNIGFTIFFSLLTLTLYNSKSYFIKYFGSFICICLFLFIPMDYGLSFLIMIVGFYLYAKHHNILYIIVSYPLVLLAIYVSYGATVALLQSLYIGGFFVIWYLQDCNISVPDGRAYSIWYKFSYAFYPAHLLILFLLSL